MGFFSMLSLFLISPPHKAWQGTGRIDILFTGGKYPENWRGENRVRDTSAVL